MGVLRPAVVRGLRRATRLLAFAVVALLGVVLVPQAFAGTFTIHGRLGRRSRAGSCRPTACTLRAAITAANTDRSAEHDHLRQSDVNRRSTATCHRSASPSRSTVAVDDEPSRGGLAGRGRKRDAGLGANPLEWSVIRGTARSPGSRTRPQAWRDRLESDGNTVASDCFGVGADRHPLQRPTQPGSSSSETGNTVGGSAPANQNVIAQQLGTASSARSAPTSTVQAAATSSPGNPIGLDANGAMNQQATPASASTAARAR